MGAFVEGEMHLVIDAIVSYPIHCLLFLASLLLIFFFYASREELRDTVLLVTRGDIVIHENFTNMRRLARDETLFLLAMPARATTLVQ